MYKVKGLGNRELEIGRLGNEMDIGKIRKLENREIERLKNKKIGILGNREILGDLDNRRYGCWEN